MPPAYSVIHPDFHVFMSLRYIPDESHVLQYNSVELDDYLMFVEELIAIFPEILDS